MADAQRLGTAQFDVARAWVPAGAADIDRDLRADFLFRNASTGSLEIWLMQGATVRATTSIGASAEWLVSAVGDGNGDGAADAFWRLPGTGVLAWWFLDGTSVAGTSVFGVDPAWAPVELP